MRNLLNVFCTNDKLDIFKIGITIVTFIMVSIFILVIYFGLIYGNPPIEVDILDYDREVIAGERFSYTAIYDKKINAPVTIFPIWEDSLLYPMPEITVPGTDRGKGLLENSFIVPEDLPSDVYDLEIVLVYNVNPIAGKRSVRLLLGHIHVINPLESPP